MGEKAKTEEGEGRFRVPWYVLTKINIRAEAHCPLDDADAARKRYKKDLDQLKPDLEAYTRQKEAALGLVSGALSRAGSSKDKSLVASSAAASTLAVEALYRDANTLTYGDNKPSEDAIDRVVSKINQEWVLNFVHVSFADGTSVQVSTKRANSRGSVSTRMKEISHTLMSTTKFSTKRCVRLLCRAVQLLG
jgi:hypothetical protein